MLIKLATVEEKFMNIEKLIKILILLCIFPVWVFFSNIFFYEKIIYSIPFFFIIIIIFYIIKKKYIKKYEPLLLAIVVTWGLDQNFSLEKKFIKTYFNFFSTIFPNIYYAYIFIIIVLFSVILFFLFINKKKFILIFFPFFFMISLFYYYEIIFRNYKIQNFDFTENIRINNKFKNKQLLFIILDEMGGINSEERDGSRFKENALQFAKKNDFNLFSNIYSMSDNTATSVPGLLNLSSTDEELLRNRMVNLKKIENTFLNDYVLSKNILFENFSSISVFQNIHLNFCLHENVKKCFQFDPYKKNVKNFLLGYKNNHLSRFLSIWKLEGSILAKILWRIGRELQVTDSYLEPEIHKASFNFFLSEIANDLNSQKFDLIFAHLLVPHIPYGFDNNCNYDGKLSIRNTFWTYEKKVFQHNHESNCTIYYLENFFTKIKNKIAHDNLEILILSDHGSRISGSRDSKYSSFLIHKKNNSKFSITEKEENLHVVVKKILINSFRKSNANININY
jgi:hypothetical protein